ncbi:MAG: DNA-formamidopyrimidine glycosylase family protein [Candidatus Limnocylindrales bacterium]
MPEGDTLARTAVVLREVLLGREVTGARGRPDGATLARTIGSRVSAVQARGKHLLIAFDNGMTLHTHLRMHGSWHRYRTGEPWRRGAARAVAVIEVPGAVAVCFDAPTVELLDTAAVAIHPTMVALGPDLLAPGPDLEGAFRRLSATANADRPIGEALLDQTVMAGLGNVYRSEVCFIERVDPFAPVGALAPETLTRLIATGSRLLAANVSGHRRDTVQGAAPGRLYVYGRTGRPCHRCRTRIATRVTGDLPRRTYWCPRCQAAGPQPRAIS